MVFYGVSSYLLLLYKQLPNKVKLLSLILNVYFIGFQLLSEGKLYSSTSLISNHCIAYRNNIISRRNIRAHPGARRGFSEAQANVVELTEAPNSEELLALLKYPFYYMIRSCFGKFFGMIRRVTIPSSLLGSF